MSPRPLRSRPAIAILGVLACGAFPGSALASGGTTAASGTTVPSVQTIGGMPAATPAASLGSASALQAAVTSAAKSNSVPVTPTEETRLRYLAAGHLQQMTLRDATAGYELASQPLVSHGTTPSGALPTASTDISCGTYFTGVENSIHYSDIVGFAVVINAGITGYCNGPGHGAIVHWGNFDAGINDGIPDGCNAEGSMAAAFHHKGEVYNGAYPEWMTMLNTFDSGLNTPFGCVGTGSEAATALRVVYNGYYDDYDDWNIGWGQPGWGDVYTIWGPYTCCGSVTGS